MRFQAPLCHLQVEGRGSCWPPHCPGECPGYLFIPLVTEHTLIEPLLCAKMYRIKDEKIQPYTQDSYGLLDNYSYLLNK